MIFIIERIGENIFTYNNFQDAKDFGEIVHFITELEKAKLELIDLWEQRHEG